MTKPERVGHCEGCSLRLGYEEPGCPGLPLPAPTNTEIIAWICTGYHPGEHPCTILSMKGPEFLCGGRSSNVRPLIWADIPAHAPMGQAEREAIADAIRWASSAASLEALEDAVRRGDFTSKEGK